MPGDRDWNASWIWGDGEPSPRNEWRCFRKTFRMTGRKPDEARLRLTADSRYVLYVNGTQVGRGPVRSWPFELAYDEYDVGHLLVPGADNTIAVLVMHFGVSTFYYLRGRGGLIAELALGTNADGRRDIAAATDATWTTAVHAGYDRRSPRMSCQHAFTETIDARSWDDGWTMPGFADDWAPATVIGPAGIEPWTRLVERDIPYLTEEPVYPVRVESVRTVVPRSWGVVIDLRNLFVPDSADHANNAMFCGYLAVTVRASKRCRATIGIVDDGRVFGPCSVNGTWYGADAFAGERPQHFLEAELREGDNLLVMDVTGVSHGHGYHFALDCAEPFEVVSPLEGKPEAGESASPFVAIGPFDSGVIVDHRPRRALNRAHPDYVRAKEIAFAADLDRFGGWVKPVDERYVSRDDVFSACVWTPAAAELPVPRALQTAVVANAEAAAVPSFPHADTELVLDFGRELSGYLAFEVAASAGTVIDLYGFEYMRDGWRQETFGLDNTMRYVCREGRQRYVSPVRRGLRYLMMTVRGAVEPLRIHSVTMLQSNFPVAEIGRFQCSDPLLNDIWHMSGHTTRLCMEDTFVDCPAFEQTFWVGDARNEALVGYYVFGDDSIVSRCLRLVPGSKFQSPFYADQVPSGWSSVIPNWTFFWAIACLELYRFNGDRSFADSIWPHVKYTLDHYWERLDDRGLFYMQGWNLLDWAPIDQPNDGVVTHQNMFLVKALRAAAELADGVDDETAATYRGRAERLRAAINAGLWSEERRAYVDCIHADGRVSSIFSMQTQVVAYLCDIADGERLDRVRQLLESPPADFVQIGSPFMSFFHYEALAKLGRFGDMLDDMRRNYGQMIDHDATACWEMYPSRSRSRNDYLTRSHCHAWSAGPGYFLGAYTLGVRGLDPGWSKVIVEPQVADLDWARGAVPHPGGGRIDVAWRIDRAAGTMHIRVASPAGVDVSVQPPAGVTADVERVTVG
ncbi:family 78 glycoside hydrolase catalytic domain [Paenibacillus flagellatus]|uniref:Alpha-L-rhamnosidase n=1 Tax=Paenibacillus flagellatus TaxID=2211139 RepID=A0A2V5KQI8_9BACL|nr:family 78 glycoside hydrolase catalytic domain [Paenibacillus flagellatus]PYI53607.1 alpha-L-rhamnosidase [Paenibacillus flagellatus]